eukprot:m.248404 g.248404  ORF g.248404 m.248404 type:complete len:280 (-) comp15720_c0_seq1:162-1001(-)
MPPKKKAAATGEKKPKKASPSKTENAGPSALELSLRLELDQLEKDLAAAKQEAADAKKKNEWLAREFSRVEEESREYEAYMMRKTLQEQSRIKNIAESNHSSLSAIEEERKKRSGEFEAKRRELQEDIMQFTAELERARKKLDDMGDVKGRRERQLQEIKDLEATLEHNRIEHSQRMQELKSKCFEDKLAFQRETMGTVNKQERVAREEAVACLVAQSEQVREENRVVRRELLEIMRENKELREREEILKKKNRDMQRQMSIVSDLTALPKVPRRPTLS